MAEYSATPVTATEVLVTGPESLWEWREEQCMPVPGHEYMPRFRRGHWDGIHVPGRWCREIGGGQWQMRCSRGLLGRLATTSTILWKGEPDKQHLQHCPLALEQIDQLRDLQKRSLIAAIQHQWGRIALATNAGKGAVIALLADLASQHGVLILCDELAVFDALGRDEVDGVPGGQLQKWANITPGLVQQSTKQPPTDPVVLAMVPTLARRIGAKASEKNLAWRDWVGKRSMVLLDEADKATAPSWRRILAYAKGSRWRLGFSGSFPDPKELPYEDLRLDELMGPIIIRAKNLELIDCKVSAKPYVKLHGIDVTHAVTGVNIPHQWWKMPGAGRRRYVFEQAIMHNGLRHDLIASLIHPDVSTAVVVNRVEHGQELANWLGVPPEVVFLDGSADREQRHAILTDFQEGRTRVLVVTKILDRGTNRLGHASDIIFASGEGSTRQTLQRIGRGLRRTGGKEFLRLVDIIDRVDTHDLPAKQHRFVHKAASYLHTSARKRIQLYRDEGFEVELTL